MPRNKQTDPRRTDFVRLQPPLSHSEAPSTSGRPRSPASPLITPNSPHDRNPSTSNRASGRRQSQLEKSRRKLRQKPGILALQEIRRFQSQVQLLISKLPSHRLVREVTQKVVAERTRDSGSRGTGGTDYRFQSEALNAIHVRIILLQ
ncbi:hypothetical protein RvY_05687 [Ramazzottius varieornatus]|uniref:Uncharacterized protein n=1 Tax=Ramazzottius varieornatus TaxID=947166 RepID=A0A1D1UVV7_RAMVA|nr:hypothetical protein RvY_05687 [Ramazzottius varieornatus]